MRFFSFNLELICTSEFFKKLKLHEPLRRVFSSNAAFLSLDRYFCKIVAACESSSKSSSMHHWPLYRNQNCNLFTKGWNVRWPTQVGRRFTFQHFHDFSQIFFFNVYFSHRILF